jgi:hypothetical protein
VAYSNQQVVEAARALRRRLRALAPVDVALVGALDDLLRNSTREPRIGARILALVRDNPLAYEWLVQRLRKARRAEAPARWSRRSTWAWGGAGFYKFGLGAGGRIAGIGASLGRGAARRGPGRDRWYPSLDESQLYKPSPKRKTKDAARAGRAEPRQRQQRWLLCRVFDIEGRRSRQPASVFRATASHSVEVRIGPPTRGWMEPGGPSLDRTLGSGKHELVVVFTVPDLELVESQPILLPAEGPSEIRRFPLRTGEPGSQVKVLISLVYAGRILQTAQLSGVAVDDPRQATQEERISFRLAVVTPQLTELDKRVPFDGTIQITRSTDGSLKATATVPGRPPCPLKGFGESAEGIRKILRNLVYDSDSFGDSISSDASVSFLRRLAIDGRMLHSQIGKPLQELLGGRKPARVQVVQTDPDVFVPLEFIYDLPAPANDAVLCRNWQGALKKGKCAPRFHHADPDLGDLGEVCPSGFWAVSTVIERQSVEQTELAKLAHRKDTSRAEPALNGMHITGFHSALFAWSEKLDQSQQGQSELVKRTLDAITSQNATCVTTWREWARVVKSSHPPLLVLLSHTTDDPTALEIGPEHSGETRALGHITSALVKASDADTPLVLLLGCDTTSADDAVCSFAARFRDCGAAVVVGTLTSVLGERVAPVASALVRALADATQKSSSKGGPPLFGEVWRQTRNQLLARGELTALCVIAYGDSGWLVGAPAA